MPVYRGSRYDGVAVTALKDTSNRQIRFLHNRTPLVQDELIGPATLYEMVEGDDLDKIAFLRARDETKWFWIADLNEIFWPFDMDEGTEILVPSVEDFRRRG